MENLLLCTDLIMYSWSHIKNRSDTPGTSYWGTRTAGPKSETPDHYSGDRSHGYWQWVYFGDSNVKRILFLMQKKAGKMTDSFSYLGNTTQGLSSPDGMVVFGFGRQQDGSPLITHPNTFYLGFIEMKVIDSKKHEMVKCVLGKILEE